MNVGVLFMQLSVDIVSICLITSAKLICKLTGDTVNKNEEHIWKHINGKRFLNKLGEFLFLII